MHKLRPFLLALLCLPFSPLPADVVPSRDWYTRMPGERSNTDIIVFPEFRILNVDSFPDYDFVYRTRFQAPMMRYYAISPTDTFGSERMPFAVPILAIERENENRETGELAHKFYTLPFDSLRAKRSNERIGGQTAQPQGTERVVEEWIITDIGHRNVWIKRVRELRYYREKGEMKLEITELDGPDSEEEIVPVSGPTDMTPPTFPLPWWVPLSCAVAIILLYCGKQYRRPAPAAYVG